MSRRVGVALRMTEQTCPRLIFKPRAVSQVPVAKEQTALLAIELYRLDTLAERHKVVVTLFAGVDEVGLTVIHEFVKTIGGLLQPASAGIVRVIIGHIDVEPLAVPQHGTETIGQVTTDEQREAVHQVISKLLPHVADVVEVSTFRIEVIGQCLIQADHIALQLELMSYQS